VSDRIEAVVDIAMRMVVDRLSRLHSKRMAVFLCVAPMGELNAKSDFCTNADRETTIQWLKQTLKTLEDGRVLEDDSNFTGKH